MKTPIATAQALSRKQDGILGGIFNRRQCMGGDATRPEARNGGQENCHCGL